MKLIVAMIGVAVTFAGFRAAAQFPNPVKAAKDAYNKAKQQQQGQQPANTQPPPQAPTAAPNPVQSGKGAPQPQAAAPSNDTGPFTPPAGTKIEPVVMAPLEQGGSVRGQPPRSSRGDIVSQR